MRKRAGAFRADFVWWAKRGYVVKQISPPTELVADSVLYRDQTAGRSAGAVKAAIVADSRVRRSTRPQPASK
jgi:hypothetical protein